MYQNQDNQQVIKNDLVIYQCFLSVIIKMVGTKMNNFPTNPHYFLASLSKLKTNNFKRYLIINECITQQKQGNAVTTEPHVLVKVVGPVQRGGGQGA